MQILLDLSDRPVWRESIEPHLDDIAPALAAEERFRAALNGRLLMAKGRWLEATRELDVARPLAAGSPALALTADLALVECHEHLGDTDLQLTASQRALTGNPESVEARAAG